MSRGMAAYVIISTLVLALLIGLAVDALTDVGLARAYVATTVFFMVVGSFVFSYAFHRGRLDRRAERG